MTRIVGTPALASIFLGEYPPLFAVTSIICCAAGFAGWAVVSAAAVVPVPLPVVCVAVSFSEVVVSFAAIVPVSDEIQVSAVDWQEILCRPSRLSGHPFYMRQRQRVLQLISEKSLR